MALGRKSVALSHYAQPANQEADHDRGKHHSRQHKPTFDFPSELCGLVGMASHVPMIPCLEETAGRPEGLNSQGGPSRDRSLSRGPVGGCATIPEMRMPLQFGENSPKCDG
jgi:hypothetical protein